MPKAPKAQAPALSAVDLLLLAILSVLWGGSFIFVKIAIVAITPLTLVFLRVAIAALALGFVLKLTGQNLPRGRSAWSAFAVMGMFNNALPFSLLFWGQTALPHEVAASLASILNATTPIFTVIVAHLVTRDEKLTRAKALGVTLGFAGVIAMVAPRIAAIPGAPIGDHGLLGIAACLGGALSYALSGVFGKRFKSMGLPPLATAFGMLTTSALLMAVVAGFVEKPWRLPLPGAPVIEAVAALALISTALAYIIFFRVLASAGATNIVLVTFLIPISAIAMSITLLGEHPRPEHFIGMALIGLGLVAIDGRVFGLTGPPPRPLRAARPRQR
jgi:drug/metabolite transporter (DMT)-like permease